MVSRPVVLTAHVRRETVEVDDALARECEPPDPGVVRSGVVETVHRVLPLFLRQRRAAARRDGLAGVFGGRLVGRGVVLGRAPFEIRTGLQTVDQRRTDRVFVGRGVVLEQRFGLLQVGENHRVVDVVDRRAGIVLGLGLRGLGQDDRNAQSQHVVAFGDRVLLELVQAYQIEVEHRPVGVGETQVGTLRGAQRREVCLVDQADHVVGRHDPRVVVVPGEGAYGKVRAERFVGSELPEPVVADVARDDQVARHGFRGEVDGRKREVPGLTVIRIARRTGLHERRRNTADHRFEGRLILGGYLRGGGIFDTAAQQETECGCRYFQDVFHGVVRIGD